jgi:hypothetical protein
MVLLIFKYEGWVSGSSLGNTSITFTIQSASVPEVETCNCAKISPAKVVSSINRSFQKPKHQDVAAKRWSSVMYFLGVIL